MTLEKAWYTASVLDALDLERAGERHFRSRARPGPARSVFGGEVAGQAVLAAGLTVPTDRQIHSAHAYFLRPGDTTVPTEFAVEDLRDGGSFSTRGVEASQGGRTIFTMTASFHRDEPGLAHQVPAITVLGPDDVPPAETMLADSADNVAWVEQMCEALDVEVRFPDLPARALAALGRTAEPRQAAWVRSRRAVPEGSRAGRLPGLPQRHAAAVGLTWPARPHGRRMRPCSSPRSAMRSGSTPR